MSEKGGLVTNNENKRPTVDAVWPANVVFKDHAKLKWAHSFWRGLNCRQFGGAYRMFADLRSYGDINERVGGVQLRRTISE